MMPARAESYSSISLWEQCPAKYKFKYIDKLADPAGPAAARGTEIHAHLEDFFAGGAWPEACTSLDPWREFIESLRREHVCQPELELAVDPHWAAVSYSDATAYFRGKIDLVLTTAAGAVTVLDWKTGNRYDSHKSQGAAYASLHNAAAPLLPTTPGSPVKSLTVAFIYLDKPPGTVDTWQYAHDDFPRLTKGIDVHIASIAENRGSENFPTRPGTGCRWCPYNVDNGGPCLRGMVVRR